MSIMVCKSCTRHIDTDYCAEEMRDDGYCWSCVEDEVAEAEAWANAKIQDKPKEAL